MTVVRLREHVIIIGGNSSINSRFLCYRRRVQGWSSSHSYLVMSFTCIPNTVLYDIRTRRPQLKNFRDRIQNIYREIIKLDNVMVKF